MKNKVIHVDEDTHAKIKERSAKERKSVLNFMAELIESYIKEVNENE